MTRHVIDERVEETTAADVDRYAKIDKAGSPESDHPGVKAAHRQPRKESGARAREYARIDRGGAA